MSSENSSCRTYTTFACGHWSLQSAGIKATVNYRVDPYFCADCDKVSITRMAAYRQTLPTVAATFSEETQKLKSRWSNLSTALQVYDFLHRPATRWSVPTTEKMEQAILIFLFIDDFFRNHLCHPSRLHERSQMVQRGHFKTEEDAQDHIATAIYRAFSEKEQHVEISARSRRWMM